MLLCFVCLSTMSPLTKRHLLRKPEDFFLQFSCSFLNYHKNLKRMLQLFDFFFSGNSSEQRGYHTLDRTPGKLMVALPHFKPVEEEVQHYQLPEKSFGDLKIQHQLSDAACASCDTSMCSVGFQSNLNQFPTSPFVSSHVSNPYVVSVTHANTDSSSYLQNNLYVLDANGYEGKTDSVETTPLSFANDSNHSVPHQNLQPFQRNSVASAHGPRPVDVHINSFSRQNPSISPTSSTSDGYPKLCSEGFQPVRLLFILPVLQMIAPPLIENDKTVNG